MRKKTSLAVILTTLGMVAFTSLLASFPFWLNSPTRSNKNDPMSPNYVKPNLGTNTPSPTYTVTPFSGSPTDTPTMTPSPTPTCTFTPDPTPVYWYTGQTPYALSDLNASAELPAGSAGFTENATGGPSVDSTYLAITTSAAGGTWNFNTVLALNAGPVNLTAAGANAISLWLRAPSNACTSLIDFRPCVSLRNPNFGYPNDRSNPVTATAYACLNCFTSSPLFQWTEMGEDNWVNVIIPLSAFVGANSQGGTFTAADLTAVSAVCLAPWWGDWNSSGGMPATEIDVADITFPTLTTLPTDQGPNAVGKMVDDFEVSSSTGGQNATMIGADGSEWEYDQDTINTGTCTGSGPYFMSATAATYPTCGGNGIGGGYGCVPVDSGGNTLSCSHAAFMSGVQNGEIDNGCGGNYPLVRMDTDFSDSFPAALSVPAASLSCPSGSGSNPYHYIEVADNAMITALPAGGASGLMFRCKTGASTGQVYTVQILRLSTTCDWANWQISIADSSLTPGTWTAITAPFPADGTNPVAAGAYDNEGNSEDLTWGMPVSWATAQPFGRGDFCKLIVRATNGGPFNFSIDDIQFY